VRQFSITFSSFATIFTAPVTTDKEVTWIEIFRKLNKKLGFSNAGFEKAIVEANEKGKPNHIL
jgi:dimeric dUTPase (all-alpha-NTP-PPase superfamily)